MNRTFAFSLLAASVLAFGSAAGDHAPVCGGMPRDRPIGPAEFRATLDSVAAGWNGNRADLAASCFTEAAVYLEPPDRQLYRGRKALREFFAASIAPARPDRMRWHFVAFDSVRQAGFGEYTYRGRQNYHGIVVVHLEGGLIRSWREYQYGSPLSWEAFVGPSR
jgi:SnoaL-like domain